LPQIRVCRLLLRIALLPFLWRLVRPLPVHRAGRGPRRGAAPIRSGAGRDGWARVMHRCAEVRRNSIALRSAGILPVPRICCGPR
jgi:hypothetical protein